LTTRACSNLAHYVCLLAIAALPSAARAENYSESVNGDLSDDWTNPTGMALDLGVNSLTATTGFTSRADEDYLQINLPANGQLSKLILQSYTGDNGLMFLGMETGTVFTFGPGDAFTHQGDLLGWVHFGPNNGYKNGDDLLPDIGKGGGAKGFTPPLHGPSYTIWFQQFDTDTTYQLDFVVTAVPEPSALQLAAVAGITLIWLASKRARSSHKFLPVCART
jgi:hypothetical protein